MRLQDMIWRQRDGTPIRIGDMTHRHLENTIRMLKRSRDKWQREADACAGYSGNPDGMGAYYADQGVDRAFEKVFSKEVWIDILSKETKRRQALSTVDEAIEIMQEGVDA